MFVVYRNRKTNQIIVTTAKRDKDVSASVKDECERHVIDDEYVVIEYEYKAELDIF